MHFVTGKISHVETTRDGTRVRVDCLGYVNEIGLSPIETIPGQDAPKVGDPVSAEYQQHGSGASWCVRLETDFQCIRCAQRHPRARVAVLSVLMGAVCAPCERQWQEQLALRSLNHCTYHAARPDEDATGCVVCGRVAREHVHDPDAARDGKCVCGCVEDAKADGIDRARRAGKIAFADPVREAEQRWGSARAGVVARRGGGR